MAHGDLERAARHQPILAAGVVNEGAAAAGRAADVVHNLQEVHVALASGVEAFPADARLQLDHGAVVGPLDDLLLAEDGAWMAGRRARGGVLRAAGEQLVERDAQLADDPVESAHGRTRAAGLDLGQRAGGDLQAASELAQAESLALALRA